MSWTLKDTLLRCGPWEILPDDRPKLEAAARRYSMDPTLSKAHRDYIARMWLPPEAPEAELMSFTFPDIRVASDPDEDDATYQPEETDD